MVSLQAKNQMFLSAGKVEGGIRRSKAISAIDKIEYAIKTDNIDFDIRKYLVASIASILSMCAIAVACISVKNIIDLDGFGDPGALLSRFMDCPNCGKELGLLTLGDEKDGFASTDYGDALSSKILSTGYKKYMLYCSNCKTYFSSTDSTWLQVSEYKKDFHPDLPEIMTNFLPELDGRRSYWKLSSDDMVQYFRLYIRNIDDPALDLEVIRGFLKDSGIKIISEYPVFTDSTRFILKSADNIAVLDFTSQSDGKKRISMKVR